MRPSFTRGHVARSPSRAALGLLAVLPLAGCAASLRRSLEADYLRQAAQAQVYHVPLPTLRSALWRLLREEGYQWRAGSESTDGWRTDWRCRGERCDRLTIVVRTLASGVTVSLDRVTREAGTDLPVLQRAESGDIAWALFERLDPAGARRAVLEAHAKADRELDFGTSP
ncbi:MAG: hypothetical protein ACYCWW_04970 [Deltaproteobacteria bacterium]